MKLHTIQIARWRIAEAKQIPFIDTTAKSGTAIFAPDWANVAKYKSGEMTEGEYTELYLEKMRQSYRNNRQYWLDFIQSPTVAIACYCTPGKFCHRLLLKDILQKLCEQQQIEFEYLGEL